MDALRTRRTGRRALAVLGGATVLALGLTGCGSADAGEAPVEKRAFAFAGKALTIDSDDSDIELQPADVKDVQVTRQVDGWVFLGNGPEATWKMDGGKLTLRVKCDAVASDCEARHIVKVPRGVAVTVEDDNGSVTVGGFDTALTVRSGNGSVTVRDSGGPLRLDSDNGDVVTERAKARTVSAGSNGDVRLGLLAEPEQVETVSDNGSILIELPRAGAPYAVTRRATTATWTSRCRATAAAHMS